MGQTDDADPITTEEIRRIAQKKLPSNVYDYYASGSDDQVALSRNTAAFDRLYVCPRVMRDVSSIDTSVTLFGHKYPLPIGIAPSAMQKLVGGEGELDMARASASLGLLMTLSSQSTTSMEDVMRVRQGAGPLPEFWHQLYMTQDPTKSIPLIRRAEAAGFEALVLTVDTPVLGNRINERKTPLALPSPLRLANLHPEPPPPSSETDTKKKKPSINRLLMDARTPQDAEKFIAEAGGAMHSSSMTWQTTIPFLRAQTSLKIILKGIMTPEDANLAIQYGADAIIVSNHGGRQLDCTSSTLEALYEIAPVVRRRIPVILDGGITRGSDIFKALALGADFVLIGRLPLWGLSYKGKEGIETVCQILERELSRTMALAGVTKVADIGKGMLGVVSPSGFGTSRL